jgi:hypothetical protein
MIRLGEFLVKLGKIATSRNASGREFEDAIMLAE